MVNWVSKFDQIRIINIKFSLYTVLDPEPAYAGIWRLTTARSVVRRVAPFTASRWSLRTASLCTTAGLCRWVLANTVVQLVRTQQIEHFWTPFPLNTQHNT